VTLPKVDYPICEIDLPSQRKKVRYRPLIVKDEKLLLIAKQSGEDGDVFTAIKQVVGNCILDPKVDVDRLPLHELEFLFLTLRIRSIGDSVGLTFHDAEDDRDYEFDVKLDEIKIKEPDVKVPNKVKVTDDVGVVMRYPPASLYDDPNFVHGSDIESITREMLLSSIESIWEGEIVHEADDVAREELDAFVESLPIQDYRKMQEFLTSVPHLEHTVRYTNSKGTEREIVLRTLNDFFTL
jgi:hypothetical protein